MQVINIVISVFMLTECFLDVPQERRWSFRFFRCFSFLLFWLGDGQTRRPDCAFESRNAVSFLAGLLPQYDVIRSGS